MYRRSLTFFFRFLVSLTAVGYLLILPAVSPAVAAQLTSQQVGQFLADPSALLKPQNSGKLVSQIRDLMLSDPQVLAPIIALLANATDAQKSAIGTGLGDAAQALVITNPLLATQIQTALAANGDKIAVAAYQTTVGNEAIGAGGGGGGGAAAYQTLTNTGGGGGGGLSTGPSTTSSAGIGLTGSGNVSNGSGSGTSTTSAASNVSAQ
jgi:hypothetical protein